MYFLNDKYPANMLCLMKEQHILRASEYYISTEFHAILPIFLAIEIESIWIILRWFSIMEIPWQIEKLSISLNFQHMQKPHLN